MNDNTGRSRGPRRRAGPRRAGVLASTALVVAACGGGGSSTGAGSSAGGSAYQKALTYAECMRAHGDLSWPDPNSDGGFVVRGSAGSSPQYLAANKVCGHLLPNLTSAQQQRLKSHALKFSACMRSRGIIKFPDPDFRGDFNLGVVQSLGVDINSPQFASVRRTCQKLTHFGEES